MREHRQSLHELRRERVGTRDSHRTIVKQDRSELDRVRSEHRRTLNRRTVFWGAHKDEASLHKDALSAAKTIARSGLDAHRRALAENPWIMMLADMVVKMEAARKEKERLRAERFAQKRAQRAAAKANKVAARAVAPSSADAPAPAGGPEETAAM
ncbi:MAG: hypothetical protein FJX78_09335 [Armatimonadetes bacterium]|nr:hypothetical protein [Armatimonadota bacterium]